MEGYFVRTLGMHRVYNSAFMNMLRDEENAKYRSVIKNTLEFDPDIMKRYVNFMSNPDERTAIDQFGKGDKCFGVCTHDGHAARPADVRPRPDRGASPRSTAWSTAAPTGTRRPNHGPGGAARAGDLPPAAPPPPLRRSRATSCSTIFSPRTARVNEDVFAYSNRQRRGARPGSVQQPLRRCAGLGADVGGLCRAHRGGQDAHAEVPRRGTRPAERPGGVRGVPGAACRACSTSAAAASCGRRGCTQSWAPIAARSSWISPSCMTMHGAAGIP